MRQAPRVERLPGSLAAPVVLAVGKEPRPLLAAVVVRIPGFGHQVMMVLAGALEEWVVSQAVGMHAECGALLGVQAVSLAVLDLVRRGAAGGEHGGRHAYVAGGQQHRGQAEPLGHRPVAPADPRQGRHRRLVRGDLLAEVCAAL